MTPTKLPAISMGNIEDDSIITAMGDGMSVQGRDFKIIYQNQRMKDLYGDCTGTICYIAYEQNNANCNGCPVSACFIDGEVHRAERSVYIDGTKHIVENTAAPVLDKNGIIIAAVEVTRDITERKEAEERHVRFKNLYAALSHTNKAIIHLDNRGELFSEICKIAVEYGKFSLAVISTINTESSCLVPVAYCGKAENYLTSLVVSADPDRAEGRGPTGIAFRKGKPYICNDFVNDPVTSPWRTAAEENGIRSSAAFPLKHEGQVIGALKVYADQKGFFDTEMVELLLEMAASVSFAMDYYAKEERRRHAEAALQENEERLRLVLEGSHEGYCDWDIATGAVKISQRYITMLGYSVGEISPTAAAIKGLIHPEDWSRVQHIFDAETTGSSPAFQVEVRMLSKTDEWVWVLYRGMVVIRAADGTPLRVTGTCSNINERKRYEEDLRYMSTHDPLTGLFNRGYFDAEMARMAHSRQYPVSILVADIDSLKLVNDSFGHSEGDRLIKQAAQALSETFRGEDLVARIGGDEFAILLPNTDADAAKELIRRILKYQAIINETNSDYTLSISIGSAVAERSEQLNEAYKNADSRMYYHKFQRKLQQRDSYQ
ncbi:MAG: diguanylate cyclase [Desulfuromonadaceae bacterium]|nr:diguanylate cyclase [Desulfuromonadaceae bacterium]